MAYDSQSYTFAEILEQIRLRLVSGLPLDTQYVRSVGSDGYKYSNEETLISVRPLGPEPYTDAGGGRSHRPMKRIIRVYISKRSSLDFVGDDSVALPLILNTEDRIYDLLDEWWPMDTVLNKPMTIEPLHPIDSSGGPPVRLPQDDIGEVTSMLTFEVCYVQGNTIPIPS